MGIKNKSKFAKQIGISRTRLYEYIEEGMPLDEEAAACEWIELNYGSSGGKNLKTSIEKKARDFDAENVPGIVVCDGDAERDDVLGILARQRQNENAAWTILKDAEKAVRDAGLAPVAAATRHYNTCSKARMETEAALVSMQNEENALAGKAEQMALEIVMKILRPLRQMLKSFPARCSQRCNPAAPELARDVLDDEMNQLFERTYLGEME